MEHQPHIGNNIGNKLENRDLDFTESPDTKPQEKITVPGVGVMTIEQAKELVRPGKIPGSNIEFNEDYTFERLKDLKDSMKKYAGLFPETKKETYVGFVQELEKRLLTMKALEDYKKVELKSIR